MEDQFKGISKFGGAAKLGMPKDHKNMMSALHKRGMLQSPLLNEGEMSLIGNQSLDPNVINAESLSTAGPVQGSPDPMQKTGGTWENPTPMVDDSLGYLTKSMDDYMENITPKDTEENEDEEN